LGISLQEIFLHVRPLEEYQMRQPKLNLKSFLPFFLMTALIVAMIFNAPPQHVLAQVPTPTPEEEPRIVGGEPANPGDWPWQVALVYGGAVDLFQDQFCGGSLIDRQWVLTAGHCVTENDGSVTPLNGLDVVAGIHNLVSGLGYQRSTVDQIIRHPLYNDDTLDYDLALIKLDTPINLGGSGATTTSLIALASPANGSFVNASSWVTGWGKIQTSPNMWDDELNQVNIPIISNSACSMYWGGAINQNNICAGLADGKDSCSGDSGGPLVVDVSGTWTLVGIVSSGTAACGDAPGIYTRVSQFTSWILSSALPQVTSITRQNTNPTNNTTVKFLVTFPVAVTGVDVADFTLTTSGVTGASITGVSGSGTSYVVTVGAGSGSGTIRLDLVDDDSIINSYLNPLGGHNAVSPGNGDFTSGEVYTIKIVSSLQAPTLRSPANKALMNNTQPTFQWTKVTGAQSYDIEFDNDSDFSSPDLTNSATAVATTSHTVGSAFAEDEYFWRVRANNSSGNPGKWSTVRSFTIDTTAPAVPSLFSPADTSILTRHTITFIWDPSASAVLYQFMYDNNADCSSPIYSKSTNKTSIRPPAIPNGGYFWCVKAKDSAGNWSGYSSLEFQIAP
jgi:secreted trypsin-like serine protease